MMKAYWTALEDSLVTTMFPSTNRRRRKRRRRKLARQRAGPKEGALHQLVYVPTLKTRKKSKAKRQYKVRR